MRHIRATHPMVYVLDNLIKSGLEECIPVIKNSHPSMWGKKAMKVSRLVANVEDGWLEASAYFVSWKTQTLFTTKDFNTISESLRGTYEDLELIHKLMHDLEPEVAMEHDKVTMAVEALVSLFNTLGHVSRHIEQVMIVECGLETEEKERTISRAKNKAQGGPMVFGGSLEDLLRHLRGEDID